MKPIVRTITCASLAVAIAFSAGAAEMKKVVILNFHGDPQRMTATTRAIEGLKQAGFVDKQNIEIIELRLPNLDEEIAQIKAIQPAVVIDVSTRVQQVWSQLRGTGIPLISNTGAENYVGKDGMPLDNITGIYTMQPDMIYNSYKFFSKVVPLKPGQQAVFFKNREYDLIPESAVRDALQRLNIPLKAVVDATIFEDWQAGTLQYNDDPEVGWFLLGVWPTVKRDGTHVDWATEDAPWSREHVKKPTIRYWEIDVQWGVLCGFATDIDEISLQCGEMAARVLNGEDIKTIKAAYPRKTLVALNRKTADTLGIVFSPDVLNLANVIYHDWDGKEVTRKSGLK